MVVCAGKDMRVAGYRVAPAAAAAAAVLTSHLHYRCGPL